MLQRAVSSHRAGRLGEAENICREALAPEFDVLHLLGVIRAQSGDFPGAVHFLRTAISVNPSNAHAFNNLGNAYKEQNRLEEATACYRRALELEPRFAEAHNNLGILLAEQGRLEAALASYRRVLELDPTDRAVGHKVAALSGKTTPAAPKEYVLELFEGYADRFEAELADLHYDAPHRLTELFAGCLPPGVKLDFGVDFGCGTGLSGIALRPLVRELWGVDISPRMAEKARGKGIYDRLVVAELGEFLQRPGRPFDVSIWTDVFIYVGDMEPVLELLARRTRAGGYFLFSTERHEGQGYALRPSGRYAHADAYVEALVRRYGFAIPTRAGTTLRVEKGETLPGSLFVAQRPDAPPG